MRNGPRTIIMKLMALAGICAYLFPAVLIIRVLLFHDGSVFYLFWAVCLSAVGLLTGTAVMRSSAEFFERLAKVRIMDSLSFVFDVAVSADSIKAALTHLTIVIPAAVSIISFSSMDSSRILFEVTVSILFYFIGLRGAFNEFQLLLSMKKIIAGIIFTMAELLAVFYHPGLSHLKNTAVLYAYVFILLSLFVRNQDSLDYNIFARRNINVSGSMAKGLRRFNMIGVSMVFIAAIGLFRFRSIVARVLEVSGIVLAYIIIIFLKILSLIIPGNMLEGKGGTRGPMLEAGPDTVVENPIIEIITKILIFLSLAFLLYIFLRLLAGAIKSLYLRIKALIMLLLAIPAKSGNAEIWEFLDEIEKVEPIEHGRDGAKHGRTGKGKKLKHITDPVEKARYIYKTAVQMLIDMRAPISRSDTAGEILNKASGTGVSNDGFGKMTYVYERVRYDDRVPGDDEIHCMETTLGQIRQGKP